MADRGGVEPPEIERLLDLYGAFVRGDLDAVVEFLDPDIEWHNPDNAVEPGIRKGPQQFLAALRLLHDSFDYEALEVEELTEIDDRVFTVLRVRGSGKGSGAPIDARFFHVWRIRAGRAVSMHWFSGRDEALAAARGES